jgi:hypothetical protein
MLNAVAVALIGLIAALVGGAIQAYATGKFERSKFERQAKWETYTSYFAALADLSFYAENSDRFRAALASMAHIRGRIALYGSEEVIEAVAGVFRFADLRSDAAQAAMANALAAMRRDVGYGLSSISKAELQSLMFNSRESN